MSGVENLSSGHAPIQYRADIDGIRALAVVAVLLFHYGIPFAAGGYIGVDVFFVLSGYLITNILLRDRSLLKFYQRRARRILPALFSVIAFSLALATALFFPGDLIKFSKSVIATIFFSSNFWFWRQSDYFAEATELWPLLHTWSLGVEEQFYIVFPIIVFVISGFRKKIQALIFIVFAVMSFILTNYLNNHAKNVFAFYMFPFRAWELLVGSVLATGILPITKNKIVRCAVASTALFSMLLPVFLYSKLTVFPGYAALPPVLGAAALIWSGEGKDIFTVRILSYRPLVFVGLISYSLYLWHWPLLAFARYVSVAPLSWYYSAVLIVFSVLVSIFSWKFIEKPFRSDRIPDNTIWRFSIAGTGLILVIASGIIYAQGFPRRFPASLTMLNADSGTTWRCPVGDFVGFGSYYACALHLPTRNFADADIVLWGDSHAQMYSPALEGALGERTALLVNVYGCAPVLGDAASASCGATQRANYAQISHMPAKIIILAQNWPQYRDEASARLGRDPLPSERYQDAIRRLRNLVHGLRLANKEVLIIAPIALPGYDAGSVISRETAFGVSQRKPEAISRAAYLNDYSNVLDAMSDLAKDVNVHVIRMDNYLCNNDICPFVQSGHANFADHGHLTALEAQKLSAALRPFIRR